MPLYPVALNKHGTLTERAVASRKKIRRRSLRCRAKATTADDLSHFFRDPSADAPGPVAPHVEDNQTEKGPKMSDGHTPGDWDLDSGFIVAPDPSGKHPDIYIAEIVTEDSEGRVAPDEQHHPNGHLLAKAPQLLRAI